MSKVCQVRLQVNGRPVELEVAPFTSLAEVLRNHLGLLGTKVGCNKGECGACTVIMNGEAVKSCLVLAPQAEGAVVLTIEGLAAEGELDRVQQAFLREGAVQCGYCTPGMIMSAVALLRRVPHPTSEEIERAMAGNLCRCTGYQKIVRAVARCAGESKAAGEPS